MTDLATVLAWMLPGGFDEPDRADVIDYMLATPEGTALEALVEAALEWQAMPRGESAYEALMLAAALESAIDAYREATK